MCADKTVFRHEKLPGYHDKPSSLWQRLPYRSDTGGVAPMFLEGLEKYTNHRIAGMTPDRRAWRKQWIQDQQLSHREPVHVPEIYLELNDPIRRAYKYPWNKFEDFLARYVVRILICYLVTYTLLPNDKVTFIKKNVFQSFGHSNAMNSFDTNYIIIEFIEIG